MAARHFKDALDAVSKATWIDPDDKEYAMLAIGCDEAVAHARWERAAGRTMQDTVPQLQVLTGENGDAGTLLACQKLAKAQPRHQHQTAIAAMWSFQLACGRLLGFPTDYKPELAQKCAKLASDLFGKEIHNSPDDHRAHRSFLLARSLVAHALGEKLRGIAYAWFALGYARKHGDKEHAVRAMLQMVLGLSGHRLACKLALRKQS